MSSSFKRSLSTIAISNMTPILSVRDLTIHFGNRTVIQHLNFTVDPGDNLAIIGPNGAGKTVLLRALLNLLPYEGVIQWAPDTKLGYVPQKIAADRHLPLHVNDLAGGKGKATETPRPGRSVGRRQGGPYSRTSSKPASAYSPEESSKRL